MADGDQLYLQVFRLVPVEGGEPQMMPTLVPVAPGSALEAALEGQMAPIDEELGDDA